MKQTLLHEVQAAFLITPRKFHDFLDEPQLEVQLTKKIMEFSIIKTDELKSIIRDELERINKQSGSSKKDWLTKEELMNMTGWSSRTIQHLRDSRQIPFSQHGRKILYPYNGIMKFLESNTVKPKRVEVLK